MPDLILRNIGELVVMPRGPVYGKAMRDWPTLQHAAMVIRDGLIAWFGPEPDLEAPPNAETLDAGGGCVLPGLIDCHTHTVFAGTRESEFVRRIEGVPYARIAKEGGGSRNSVATVRDAGLDDLVGLSRPRLHRMLQRGVTTVEIKSGYGLTVDDELKMLRAVQRLRADTPQELIGTYLAAHTLPPECEGDPEGYIDMVTAAPLLATIREEGLAEFSDAFCETTAFGVEPARRFLRNCASAGLRPKLHADQITQMGASRLAAELRAVSADHLETIDEEGIAALKASGTIAVLLPACSFYLGVDQAPARRLIDAGLPIAVATDFNPGSAMVESLLFTMGIACTQMRMTPDEVLTAVTANAAAALQRQDRLGAIELGMQADLLVLDVPNRWRLCYELGRNATRAVIKKGAIVVAPDGTRD